MSMKLTFYPLVTEAYILKYSVPIMHINHTFCWFQCQFPLFVVIDLEEIHDNVAHSVEVVTRMDPVNGE
jgi:hypothetical protein